MASSCIIISVTHAERETYLQSSCTIAHLITVRMMTNKRDSKSLKECVERKILNYCCRDCKQV